jgi:hypothetical protein
VGCLSFLHLQGTQKAKAVWEMSISVKQKQEQVQVFPTSFWADGPATWFYTMLRCWPSRGLAIGFQIALLEDRQVSNLWWN